MRLRVEMGQGRDKPAALYTEDGELIEGVLEINWHAKAVDRPKFTITVAAEKCDIDTGDDKKEDEMAKRLQVQIVNRSTVVTDEELTPIIAALQVQVTEHFRPTWGIAALLEQVALGDEPDPQHFWLGVFDDADQAGALGYHDLTPQGLPVGKAFAKTDQQYGAKLSVTLSHELLEMLGDPYINDCVLDGENGRLYAKENADAVEADELGYDIDGVTVSDFVLPEFFDPQHAGKGAKLSYCGHVTEPFSLAPGGYLSYIDLADMSAGWKQVTAETETAEPEGERPSGFPDGSRRDRRRRAARGELKVSNV